MSTDSITVILRNPNAVITRLNRALARASRLALELERNRAELAHLERIERCLNERHHVKAPEILLARQWRTL